jgi:hypothetical protein
LNCCGITLDAHPAIAALRPWHRGSTVTVLRM